METFQLKTKKQLDDVQAFDLSKRLYPDLTLGYDEHHDIVIIDRGMKDIQARIEAAAANVPSLAELCAGLPGDTPLQQLQNAIDAGILPQVDTSGDVVDYTEVPESIGDFVRTGQEARKVLGSDKDIASLVNDLVEKRLAELKAEEAAKASAEKGENK